MVFATETLAIGVNMPARSVVFTQVDKPKDKNEGGHRWLRPDEFWQMAGRAGRRGMDVKGYVVYAPTLSVAGLKNQVDRASLRLMMTGAMPAATSQLEVNTPFVLRHLARGHGPEVMQQTLLADQLKRNREFMQVELEAQLAASGGGGAASAQDEIAQLASEFSALDAKLKGTSSDGLGMFLKLDKKQEKKMMARKKEILAACGGDEALLTSHAKARETAASLQKAIGESGNQMSVQWESAIAWLSGKRFVVRDASEPSGYKLLPRGQACAAFSEGFPLVIGTVIADGYLEGLTFAEICAWLCLFLKKGRTREAKDLKLPDPSEALTKAWDRSDFLMDEVLTCVARFFYIDVRVLLASFDCHFFLFYTCPILPCTCGALHVFLNVFHSSRLRRALTATTTTPTPNTSSSTVTALPRDGRGGRVRLSSSAAKPSKNSIASSACWYARERNFEGWEKGGGVGASCRLSSVSLLLPFCQLPEPFSSSADPAFFRCFSRCSTGWRTRTSSASPSGSRAQPWGPLSSRSCASSRTWMW